MAYPPDPGGNFASDAHRRIMAHLPNPDDTPITLEELIQHRVNRDPYTLTHFTSAVEILGVLHDLEDDGHAEELETGWQNTPAGFDTLTGPPTSEAAHDTPATIDMTPAMGHGEA